MSSSASLRYYTTNRNYNYFAHSSNHYFPANKSKKGRSSMTRINLLQVPSNVNSNNGMYPPSDKDYNTSCHHPRNEQQSQSNTNKGTVPSQQQITTNDALSTKSSKRTYRTTVATTTTTTSNTSTRTTTSTSTTPNTSGNRYQSKNSKYDHRRINDDDNHDDDALRSFNRNLQSLIENRNNNNNNRNEYDGTIMDIQSVYRAQELYYRISALYNEGYYSCHPDIVSFNIILKGWKYHPIQALEFWESVLFDTTTTTTTDDGSETTTSSVNEQQQQEVIPPSTTIIIPNRQSYNLFLLSLANTGQYETAIELLHQLIEPDSTVRPDVVTYNTILLACVINGSYEAAIVAEDIVYEMLSSSVQSPTIETYYETTSTVHTPKNNNEKPSETLSSTSKNINDILQELLSNNKQDSNLYYCSINNPIRPDIITFNTMLVALSNHQSILAANRADQWFEYMQHQRKQNSTIAAVIPDIYTYTSLLQVWIKCGNTSVAAERAIQLKDELETISSSIQPNAVFYTLVIQALCNNEQPQSAQKLLDEIVSKNANDSKESTDNKNRIEPDVVMYSSLIDGWVSVASEEPDTAIQAVFRLLQQMNDSCNTKLKPNAQTYTGVYKVIAASRRKDAGQLAEQIVQDSIVTGIPPNIIHYNAVFDCYAKSINIRKAIQAIQFWYRVFRSPTSPNSNSVRPDIVSYNAMLCCVATAGSNNDHIRQQSLQIGFEIFNLLLSKVVTTTNNSDTVSTDQLLVLPTSLTFYYMFKTIRRLMPNTEPKREQLIEKLYRLCCDYGCLNSLIVQQIQLLLLSDTTTDNESNDATITTMNEFLLRPAGTIPKHITTLPSDSYLQLNDLPSEWSRNALSDRKKRFQNR